MGPGAGEPGGQGGSRRHSGAGNVLWLLNGIGHRMGWCEATCFEPSLSTRYINTKAIDLPMCPVQFAAEEMDPETSTLWFAGKQMLAEKQLKDYVGRHEKTKVVVKLQKKGAGAPAREPVSAGGVVWQEYQRWDSGITSTAQRCPALQRRHHSLPALHPAPAGG